MRLTSLRVATFFLGLVLSSVAAAADGPRIVTFKCDVTPSVGQPLMGCDLIRTVEQPLLAKGVVIEADGRRYVLCAVDWCVLCNEAHDAMRRAIAVAADADVSNVALQTVHQHTAPVVDIGAQKLLAAIDAAKGTHIDMDVFRAIENRLAGAVRRSLCRLEPFDTVGAGEAKVERVASSRRPFDSTGKLCPRMSSGGADPLMRQLPEGAIDPYLKTITFARQGKPLVRLHYYATHPQTKYRDGRASSDFVGWARETLEKEEGVFQIYFAGCGGNVTVGKYNDGSPKDREGLQQRLLAGMKAAVAATRMKPAREIHWKTRPLLLPARSDGQFSPEKSEADMKNAKLDRVSRLAAAVRVAFRQRSNRPLEISSLHVGDIHILNLAGEPCVEFQQYARQLLSNEFVAVAGYGNCGMGYICPAKAFAEGGYEPTGSNVKPESEELLKRAIRASLGADVDMISVRHCFVRMESPALPRFAVTNRQHTPLVGANVDFLIDGAAVQRTKLVELAPGKTAEIEYRFDTSLRPDEYPVTLRLDVAGEEPYQIEEKFWLRIVPRPTPRRFPVVMWGIDNPDRVMKEMTRLKDIGFNHVLGFGADCKKIWESGKPTEAENGPAAAKTRRMLDEALANDMTIVAALSPGRWLKNPEFRRIDRQNKPYSASECNICGLFSPVREFCHNVGASVAGSYGGFPAFGAAMIHTEVRDYNNLCFHKHDLKTFRQASGFDIPANVGKANGVNYGTIAGFPADRVIPDDYPLYVFYRWYWKTGDGWNGLNDELCRGLKSAGRNDLWTYHDPAARVPSVYGNGGKVDVLSQWTYSYPDPIRIAVATDELLAMAGGADVKQDVMKMTQIIWYRNQTAPMPKTPAEVLSYQARWEREKPDAPFITIAPMHLREAFWTKIARPIKGIMYHGWESLAPTDREEGYFFTNPETQRELARLLREVLRPLGPTLLQTPGARSNVAFLESFASEMFARRGTYGWGGSWLGDAYHVMLYAHLQPEIVFDETIMTRGLDGFRVLVMPHCDVITKTMAERIKSFQARGGIVVGDEFTAPAIKPNIRMKSYNRINRNDRDKAALQAIAAKLREQLDKKYVRHVDSSNPDVIPYSRRHGQTDYVFLVNDRREYGRYVGQHGLVMENGLLSRATVTIDRPDGVAYDLVGGRLAASGRKNGRLSIEVDLGPCDGRVYMISPQPIDGIRIQSPAAISRGASETCRIEVFDAQKQPVGAIVPLQVSIHDPDGRLSEFSGYYGAVDGTVKIPLDIASNDLSGDWLIEARELASGREAVRSFRVPGPAVWPPTRSSFEKTATPLKPRG